MTGSTKGTAYSLRSEAGGAGNRSNANTAPHPTDQAIRNRTTTGLPHQACHKSRLIGGIKQAVAELVLATGEAARTKNSAYLSRRLSHDYSYLANLFSEETGSTIEQYIIVFRISRVQDLLLSSELTLTQIAYQLKYSSVGHLSNQFKKVMGLTPSSFRKRYCQHEIIPESGNIVRVFCNYVNIPEVRRVKFAA